MFTSSTEFKVTGHQHQHREY